MAASMGAVLLVAGEKGKRSALRHSRVMIHQPSGGGSRGGFGYGNQPSRNAKTEKKNFYDIYLRNTLGRPMIGVEKGIG